MARFVSVTIRQSRRRIISGVTIVVLISLVVSPLFISLGRADYSVRLGEGGVSVHISADFIQGVPNISANNTADKFANIPLFRFYLQGQNSSIFANYLDNAIKARSPSAGATQVVLNAISNGTALHYELSFNVAGISTKDGVETVDLSWRSFVIKDDFGIGNVSINKVLPTYLQGMILLLAQRVASRILQEQLLWYVNNGLIPASQIGSAIRNLSLFNFTSLASPLQSWTSSLDVAGSLVRYQASTGFNLTFIDQITEAGETANFARDAIYKMKAIVEAPIGAVASGDTLTFETKGAWQSPLMLTSIVASLGLLVATTVVERHVRLPRRLKVPKGKR